MDAFTVLAVENLTNPQKIGLELLAHLGEPWDIWITARTRACLEHPDVASVNFKVFTALESLGLACISNPGYGSRRAKLTDLGREAAAHLGLTVVA